MTDLVTSRWVDSATAVPDDHFEGRFFCTTVAWTRAWESVRSEQVRGFRHLALEGGPVSELVPYYLVDRSPLWTVYEDTAGAPPVWTGPVAYSSTVYGEHGAIGGSCSEYIARAVDLGLEQAARWGAEALVFANLTQRALDAWTAVRPSGTAVLLDKTYEAPVGGSERALLARMRGKVRREFVRQWRRALDAGVRLRSLAGAEMLPYLDDFTRLAVDSSEKHGDNLYGADMFHSLAAVPGAVLLLAEHRGRMVGAFYCFLHRDRFAMVIAGIDYEKLRELNTYGFLMYESLRYAVEHDAEILDPGRCNFAYKERHAFRGTDLWALAYLPEPRPDLVEGLERMNKGMHEYIARNVSPDDRP
jgi:hypothetical protein